MGAHGTLPDVPIVSYGDYLKKGVIMTWLEKMNLLRVAQAKAHAALAEYAIEVRQVDAMAWRYYSKHGDTLKVSDTVGRNGVICALYPSGHSRASKWVRIGATKRGVNMMFKKGKVLSVVVDDTEVQTQVWMSEMAKSFLRLPKILRRRHRGQERIREAIEWDQLVVLAGVYPELLDRVELKSVNNPVPDERANDMTAMFLALSYPGLPMDRALAVRHYPYLRVVARKVDSWEQVEQKLLYTKSMKRSYYRSMNADTMAFLDWAAFLQRLPKKCGWNRGFQETFLEKRVGRNHTPTRDIEILFRTYSPRMIMGQLDRMDLVKDIGRLYKELIRLDVPFEFPRQFRVQHLHDVLAELVIRHQHDSQKAEQDMYRNKKLSVPEEIVLLDGTPVGGYTLSIPRKGIDLMEMGAALQNCVGSYIPDAVSGSSLILGLRDPTSIRYCAEYKRQRGGYYRNALLGYANSQPSSERLAWELDNVVLSALNKGGQV